MLMTNCGIKISKANKCKKESTTWEMFWRFGKLTIALGGGVAQNREKGSKPILRPVPTFTLTFISTVATQGWPLPLQNTNADHFTFHFQGDDTSVVFTCSFKVEGLRIAIKWYEE